MTSHGNPTQWGSTYPPKALLAQDIEDGNSYVCEEHGNIIATFYYKEGRDDTYTKIYNGQWLDESPYGVVHRITSDGTILLPELGTRAVQESPYRYTQR